MNSLFFEFQILSHILDSRNNKKVYLDQYSDFLRLYIYIGSNSIKIRF